MCLFFVTLAVNTHSFFTSFKTSLLQRLGVWYRSELLKDYVSGHCHLKMMTVTVEELDSTVS